MATELADTSAWVVAARDEGVHRRFINRVLDLRISTCGQVMLELLYSTKNATEFAKRRRQLSALDRVPITEDVFERALDVYELLAAKGGSHHRQVKHAGLVIAASAELAGLRVVHYDSDFDAIAAVTGQPTEWLAPRGSM